MIFLFIIGSILVTLLTLRLFRKPITKWLMTLRARLQIRSLRAAIDEADEDRGKTGRKNIVVFNTSSGRFEPISKRLLKLASSSSKNKSNRSKTKGAVKMQKPKKDRVFTDSRVKNIEKKSLYVTK